MPRENRRPSNSQRRHEAVYRRDERDERRSDRAPHVRHDRGYRPGRRSPPRRREEFSRSSRSGVSRRSERRQEGSRSNRQDEIRRDDRSRSAHRNRSRRSPQREDPRRPERREDRPHVNRRSRRESPRPRARAAERADRVSPGAAAPGVDRRGRASSSVRQEGTESRSAPTPPVRKCPCRRRRGVCEPECEQFQRAVAEDPRIGTSRTARRIFANSPYGCFLARKTGLHPFCGRLNMYRSLREEWDSMPESARAPFFRQSKKLRLTGGLPDHAVMHRWGPYVRFLQLRSVVADAPSRAETRPVGREDAPGPSGIARRRSAAEPITQPPAPKAEGETAPEQPGIARCVLPEESVSAPAEAEPVAGPSGTARCDLGVKPGSSKFNVERVSGSSNRNRRSSPVEDVVLSGAVRYGRVHQPLHQSDRVSRYLKYGRRRKEELRTSSQMDSIYYSMSRLPDRDYEIVIQEASESESESD